jgi:hypothetical protein
MKKKITVFITLILMTLIVFTFTACGEKPEPDPQPDALPITYGVGNWNGDVSTLSTSNTVREGLHYAEFGEYPTSYVGDTLNSTLEGMYTGQSSELTTTGKSYTTNGVRDASTTNTAFTAHNNPEFLFSGEKYVRTTAKFFGEGEFDNGTVPVTGNVYWFKVEPIKWLIANWDNLPASINPDGDGTATEMLLVANEIIMANIPFASDSADESALWENSEIRTWLNESFYDEALGETEKALIKATEIDDTDTTASESNYASTAAVNKWDNVRLVAERDVYAEQSRYNAIFNLDASRRSTVSDFALAWNAQENGSKDANEEMGFWWVDGPGPTFRQNFVIGFDGFRNTVEMVNTLNHGIRPAVDVSFDLEVES